MSAVVSGKVYPDKRPDPVPVGPRDIVEELKKCGVEVFLVDGRPVGRNLRSAPLTLIEAFAQQRRAIADHLTDVAGSGGVAVSAGTNIVCATPVARIVLDETVRSAPAIARVAYADRAARDLAAGWAYKIDQIHVSARVSKNIATLLDRARRVVDRGWCLQAARMGWNELEVFGLSRTKPWERLDQRGIAFSSHALVALGRDIAAYEHALRRHRNLINQDSGVAPIWEVFSQLGETT